MPTRAVTGTIERADGSPWPSVEVVFRMERYSYSPTQTNPKDRVSATTDANGQFTVNLEAGLSTRWICSHEGAPSFFFSLPVDGAASVSIEELRAIAGVPDESVDALAVAIEAHMESVGAVYAEDI